MKFVLSLLFLSALLPVAPASRGVPTPIVPGPSAVTATFLPAPDLHFSAGRPIQDRSPCAWHESALDEGDPDDSDELSYTPSPSDEFPDLDRAATRVARRLWDRPHPEARHSILLC